MTHGAFTFSDHCPIIINTAKEVRHHNPCPFRFQFLWTKYHEIDKLIHKKWNTTVKGTKMFMFSHKLKTIKNSLKPWAKSTFIISMKKSQATWIKLIM